MDRPGKKRVQRFYQVEERETKKKKQTKNNNIRTKKSCCLAKQSCFTEAIHKRQNAFAKYLKDKQTLAVVRYRLQSGLTEKVMQLKEPENENRPADLNIWCPGVEVGEVIDTPLNPVLYQN